MLLRRHRNKVVKPSVPEVKPKTETPKKESVSKKK
jgi:hypothetical protein